MPVIARTVLLLLASNLFMTFAWYGHLKLLENRAWWVAALISWGVAFFEYLLQVPANRIGFKVLSLGQLKILQEAITLAVFVVFAWAYLGERINLRYGISFALMFCAVWVAFGGR